jgi:hypothetical protein
VFDEGDDVRLHTVCADRGSEQDPGLQVHFVVGDEIDQVRPLELVSLLGCRSAAVLNHVLDGKVVHLFSREPFAGEGGCVWHDEEARGANDNSHDAFQQEDPRPTWSTADAVHLCNAEGQKT